MTQILELNGVSKSFGAVTVADGLTYGLIQGEALGVLGPNGAGKTSMFNLITGTLQPDGGRITFAGEDITSNSAARRSRAGIARSFQVPQPFTHMTVFENAMVAATQSAGLRGHEAERLCVDVLDQTELLGKANDRAGGLTLLNRKRLELTRALCAKPRLLLLDEIAGGLTEAECTSLISTIKSIHANGVSIIWIEHVVHALMAVVERLIVIDFGRKIAEGEPKAIMDSPEVQEIYLGIEADA
ncbi:ABC transporter ATP-binding protein [Primorskyibacter flagellatus]|uniref:Amino acid/amide ABC transporter ATP-binding protein 1, HAAT family n=1 Tax=Primorskyibacter flagellatus TaxID=1387277 RepID=A0A1W2E2C7_9RHOB|nr:ABC transporter ATP-binding protein [Primorskyibacter flagellatus]SMD03889.1 amino acid/amide ABC transporter ATP-binding protein 1, HAAT family [Primorskyibacter flagellatus]